jgi:SAM-dependent methyltransferase
LNLIHFDGSVIPLPPNSVHVAYSNQLMEHLHPDDAVEQLRSIQRVLTPHGVYVCLTPNRLTGPHDISKYFEDEVASGFHLKEYTNTEVEHLFKLVGFSRVKAFGLARGFSVRFPVWTVRLIEHCVQLLPGKVGKMLARSKGMKIFVNRFYLVAEK